MYIDIINNITSQSGERGVGAAGTKGVYVMSQGVREWCKFGVGQHILVQGRPLLIDI